MKKKKDLEAKQEEQLVSKMNIKSKPTVTLVMIMESLSFALHINKGKQNRDCPRIGNNHNVVRIGLGYLKSSHGKYLLLQRVKEKKNNNNKRLPRFGRSRENL